MMEGFARPEFALIGGFTLVILLFVVMFFIVGAYFRDYYEKEEVECSKADCG
ncbi:hypothetical protein K1720_05500 [Thermococcus argininiproducens]|uniref:Uncharacterized protein n=1 Tax=Thermococcus argininiproducens TaxID=2866384 RepID=A0A9E7M8R8_9EURY|nr:hypothetical protein [Thermococcus argininiproducens]USG99012.1 hypothetical protein K1720_05500 [Thermococcus argininiproducens]